MVVRRNSGSSSRKSIAIVRDADLAGTGIGTAPDKANIGNGVVRGAEWRVATKEWAGSRRRPQMLWILVDSMASSKVSGGMIVGMRLAIMDLPEPGGPMKRA